MKTWREKDNEIGYTEQYRMPWLPMIIFAFVLAKTRHFPWRHTANMTSWVTEPVERL
jgi:hypothetical protein